MQNISLLEIFKRFELETKARKALSEASIHEIKEAWEKWDGVSAMKIKGTYIPDSWIVSELQKNGIDVDL